MVNWRIDKEVLMIKDLKKVRRKRSKYEGKTKIYEVLKHKDSKEL